MPYMAASAEPRAGAGVAGRRECAGRAAAGAVSLISGHIKFGKASALHAVAFWRTGFDYRWRASTPLRVSLGAIADSSSPS